MYLIDTNVISERRKGERSDRGVRAFFLRTIEADEPVYIASVTLGEIRRGVEKIRRRGDETQARLLEAWLADVVETFGDRILDLNAAAADVWGRLRVPDPEPAIDKQIAAIALVNDLTLVTHNLRDFRVPGLRLLDPFEG